MYRDSFMIPAHSRCRHSVWHLGVLVGSADFLENPPETRAKGAWGLRLHDRFLVDPTP
jgi:hypothetical protein